LDLKNPHPPGPEEADLVGILEDLVKECIGRGVASLPELNDKLLLKQSSVGGDNPLGMGGVSHALLRQAIERCGAVEIVIGRQTLFAFTHGDKVGCHVSMVIFILQPQVREIILELFKTQKSVRKKQVMDAARTAGVEIAEKAVTSTLKVCAQ